jgi:plasmid stabilization system protein ParE
MRLRFTGEAQIEIRDSAAYYDREWRGLGGEFLDELQDAFDAIREAPERWQLARENVRRYLLRRFPYAVYYRVHESEAVILSVAHFKRKPDYWRGRG